MGTVGQVPTIKISAPAMEALLHLPFQRLPSACGAGTVLTCTTSWKVVSALERDLPTQYNASSAASLVVCFDL